MVLDRSDYKVSNLWNSTYDPTSTSTYTRLAGAAVALTMLLYVFGLASNKGVPLMNRVVGMIPGIGGNLQTDTSVEVF
jgi:hypothetical protein